MKIKNIKGASALPVTLLLTGIILELVIAGVIIAQLFSRSILSDQLAMEALKAAESGAHDAILRVNKFINCPSNDFCPAAYEIIVVEGQFPRKTCVNLSEAAGQEGSTMITVLSKGTVFTRERTIETVLEVFRSEARVEVQSFREIETPSGITCP